MKTNFVLIVVGTVMLSAGLYRIHPLKLDGKSLMNLVPVSLFFVGMLALVFYEHQTAILPEALDVTLRIGGQYMPMLVILFASMGLGTALATVHHNEIVAFLMRHGQLGGFAAAFFMVSSSVASRVVDKLWMTAPWLRLVLMTFLQAAPMVSISIFMMRLIGIENREIIVKNGILSVIMALLAIPVIRVFNYFFPL